MSKVAVKTTLDVEHTIRPIYTGGSLVTDKTGRILVACVEEDIAITDLETGEQLALIEGVSIQFCGFCIVSNLLTYSSHFF